MRVPLFSGYIFVRIEKGRIYEVLRAPKIVRCVTFNRIPASLRQSEVDSIIQLTENDYPLEVSCDLKVGDPVVVSKGALMGMEGVLVEERGNQRFALRIESLHQSMLVNIPADHLELSGAAV
jgi:transcription antitermination factor NusG